MRVQLPFWILVIMALAVTSCGSFEVEAGFKQPFELTAVAKAMGPTNVAELTPGAAPEVSHATYQPASPDGRLVTLDGAKARVQKFLGERDLVLQGWFVDHGAPQVAAGSEDSKSKGRLIVDMKEFVVQRQVTNVRYPDEFNVDAKTGEVRQANLVSNTLLGAPRRPVTEATAKAVAEEFARTRYADFGKLTVKEEGRLGQAAGGDPVFSVRWGQRAADSEAWLPAFVWVDVDLETGRVVHYSSGRGEYDGPTTPQVSRERAVEIALAEARRDPRTAGATVGPVELRAGNGPAGQPELNWVVLLEGVPKESLARRHILVDAISGSILNPFGSPLG